MIQTKDLRIGNYIRRKSSQKVKEVIEVLTTRIVVKNDPPLDIHKSTSVSLNLFEPIRLNQEILELCNFTFFKGSWIKTKDEITIKIEYAGSHCTLLNYNGYIGKPFQYLHQLQNIFHSLYQTDIKINL